MKRLFVRIRDWQLHHKMWAFSLILLGTILFVRLSVQLINPNPLLFDFELHHFDYGLVLLIITVLLLLFGPRRESAYLVMSAISIGLILDDLWFIRGNLVEPDTTEMLVYNSTLPSVLLLLIVVILLLLLIRHQQKRSQKQH